MGNYVRHTPKHLGAQQVSGPHHRRRGGRALGYLGCAFIISQEECKQTTASSYLCFEPKTETWETSEDRILEKGETQIKNQNKTKTKTKVPSWDHSSVSLSPSPRTSHQRASSHPRASSQSGNAPPHEQPSAATECIGIWRGTSGPQQASAPEECGGWERCR